MHKRIIIEHRTGKLAGMRQIIGWKGDDEEASPFEPFVNLGDHIGPIGLVRITPRMLLYIECAGPAAGHFNDFHPSQV